MIGAKSSSSHSYSYSYSHSALWLFLSDLVEQCETKFNLLPVIQVFSSTAFSFTRIQALPMELIVNLQSDFHSTKIESAALLMLPPMPMQWLFHHRQRLKVLQSRLSPSSLWRHSITVLQREPNQTKPNQIKSNQIASHTNREERREKKPAN